MKRRLRVRRGDDDRIARRNDISPEEIDNVIALARLDRSGAWTHRTLQLIERATRASSRRRSLAMPQERPAFKLNVRKLKELGLTESLDVGYRLSPRGEAVLRQLR